MRLPRTYVAVLFSVVFPIQLFGQQTTPTTQSSPQALILLRQSLATLSGGQTITDVTLTGTARRIAGSDDESGSATMKAISGDAGRIDLSLPSGPRSEILNSTSTPATGVWSGPDGVVHPIASHNLLTESAWFFPAFAIGRLLASGNYVVLYVGQETHNGRAVQHLVAKQASTFQTPPGVTSFTHLTQMDLFLDSNTLLPAALDFNIHPDNDVRVDLPVEIDFFDYRAVNGSQVPFHLQKSLNDSLILDFQAQSVSLNTGLAASSFNAL